MYRLKSQVCPSARDCFISSCARTIITCAYLHNVHSGIHPLYLNPEHAPMHTHAPFTHSFTCVHTYTQALYTYRCTAIRVHTHTGMPTCKCSHSNTKVHVCANEDTLHMHIQYYTHIQLLIIHTSCTPHIQTLTVCAYVHICANMNTMISLHTSSPMHTCTHLHTYTYTPTHTHIHTPIFVHTVCLRLTFLFFFFFILRHGLTMSLCSPGCLEFLV